MVAPLFERLKCEVTVELDLSVKVQRLDMVVVTQREPKPISFYDVNPDYYEGFENLNEHNLISFKSFNESFNQTAIEEFYGHFTNYKKMRNLENESEKINLYAVTTIFQKSCSADTTIQNFWIAFQKTEYTI